MRKRRHARLGAVDQELGEPLGIGLRRGRRRTELEQLALQLVDPVSGRSGDVGRRSTIRASSSSNGGGSGRRSTLFRTTTCCRSASPAPYSSSSWSIWRNCSLDVVRGDVDHVQKQTRALEMREELVPEPDALARALDQPRHVGDGQLAPVGRLDRAEHRLQRRERVVGDFRLRVRDPAEQRGLAGVRQADERRVGEQLQPELEVGLLAGEAGLGKARSLPGRRREVPVAAPAPAAARDRDARAGHDEVGDDLVVDEDLRPDRDLQLDVVAVCAVLARAAPVLAAPRLELALRPEARTGRGGRRRQSRRTSPPRPPSPPSGPTFGHELLAAEAHSPPSPPRPASTWICARSWNMTQWPKIRPSAGPSRAAQERHTRIRPGRPRSAGSCARCSPGSGRRQRWKPLRACAGGVAC